jgi:SAM-dependent methyltransferase
VSETETSKDFTQRFTGRVEAYKRFRPRYPAAILEILQMTCGLTPETVVADVGAGTGMLAEVFLANGNRVFAIEPNAEMRAACEELENSYPKLTCINGTAEATGLPAGSIDLVAAGRAFHWFDPEKSKTEFARILRGKGWVALLGLGRPGAGQRPMALEMERIMREYGTDYAALKGRYKLGDRAREFFGGALEAAEIQTLTAFTWDEFLGNAISLSVMPMPGEPRFEAFEHALRRVFEKYQSNGKLEMPIECKMYFGRLG